MIARAVQPSKVHFKYLKLDTVSTKELVVDYVTITSRGLHHIEQHFI